mmetsp:Transcript_34312/g.76142  ORF Transcript_34312/g.76142 Transcript_34312/m.76142 type:complete len:246 (-) Transcript_34312:4116-4853(-)
MRLRGQQVVAHLQEAARHLPDQQQAQGGQVLPLGFGAACQGGQAGQHRNHELHQLQQARLDLGLQVNVQVLCSVDRPAIEHHEQVNDAVAAVLAVPEPQDQLLQRVRHQQQVLLQLRNQQLLVNLLQPPLPADLAPFPGLAACGRCWFRSGACLPLGRPPLFLDVAAGLLHVGGDPAGRQTLGSVRSAALAQHTARPHQVLLQRVGRQHVDNGAERAAAEVLGRQGVFHKHLDLGKQRCLRGDAG